MSEKEEVDIMFGQVLVQAGGVFSVIQELLRNDDEFEQAKARDDLKAIAEITREREILLRKLQKTREEMEAFGNALAGRIPDAVSGVKE